MALRHLRCFQAVAEELHFARAAEKLHIDQSLLSRTIKELEDELGAQLFTRTTRSTLLTHAGKVLLKRVPRIFAALEQARDGVKSTTNGFHGQLRIALSDGITPSRLSAVLAQCRVEDPDVEASATGRSRRRPRNPSRRRISAMKLRVLPPYAAERSRLRRFYCLCCSNKYGFFRLNRCRNGL